MVIFKNRKCNACRFKLPKRDMHLLNHEIEVRRYWPEMLVRNLIAMLLNQKPKNIKRRSWLFGHYKLMETKTVKRWYCFDCYVGQLTPEEFELFRRAYHDSAVVEEGPEHAAELVARLDELFHDRSGVQQ